MPAPRDSFGTDQGGCIEIGEDRGSELSGKSLERVN